MTSITLHVYGTPAPQGSKRHVGGGRLIESSKKVGPWREAVVSEIQRSGFTDLRMDGPIIVSVIFYLQRPASHSNTKGIKPSAPVWPAKTPDLDKILRSTFDALTQSQVITDDSRIVSTYACKQYADDRAPGAAIHLTEALEIKA